MGQSATTTKTAPAPARAKPRPAAKPEPKQPRIWRVVLLDDDDHSYEYVIELLAKVFHFPAEKGYQIAKAVDSQGRAVVITTHREHAELKQEQIHSFGADPRIASCSGAMSAILEPADLSGGDDASDDSPPRA